MEPKVYIIILNWNGLEDTLECLESVFRMDYGNFKVVVVDNGSTDDSVAVIRKLFPDVILIESKENLGYTGGNNLGIRYAMDHGADYMWLLNNDTVVERDTLRELVASAEGCPDIGMISPAIYYYGGPHKIQSLGSHIDWKNFQFPVVKDREQLRDETFRKNMFLWGTALLIKRAVIDSIGYLNEKYFAYQEDAEYSVRAAKGGYGKVIHDTARVYHKNSRSTEGLTSPIQVFLRVRNTYFFWMANLKGFRKLSYLREFMADTISYAATLKNENLFESAEACLSGGWCAVRSIGGPWNKNIRLPWLIKQIVFWHPYFWASLSRGDIVNVTSQILRRTMAKVSKIA